MLKIIGYTGLLLFMNSQSHAQKIIEKTWNANLFQGVEIISDEVFQIRIISEATRTISAIVRIDGEYSENIVLQVKENEPEQGILQLSTGLTPFFVRDNDKLAAHKVMAIEMELHIPENFMVNVRSSLASVTVKGIFQTLQLELDEGNCLLTYFEGDARLRSLNGDITAYCHNTVAGIVETRNGVLINKLSRNGDFILEAQSVNGDITLLPSQ